MGNKGKYYTPSIEEFHVGFEYEIFLNNKWNRHTVPIKTNLEHLQCVEGEIRVKYLDKEDIENLGFEVEVNNYQEMSSDTQYIANYIMNNGTKCFIKFISYYKIDANPNVENGYLTIWKDNTTKYNFRKYYVNEPKIETVFKGKVKNKSELKKVLEQVELYNNLNEK